jgi:hypothetical protein
VSIFFTFNLLCHALLNLGDYSDSYYYDCCFILLLYPTNSCPTVCNNQFHEFLIWLGLLQKVSTDIWFSFCSTTRCHGMKCSHSCHRSRFSVKITKYNSTDIHRSSATLYCSSECIKELNALIFSSVRNMDAQLEKWSFGTILYTFKMLYYLNPLDWLDPSLWYDATFTNS